jgi:type I restriction enzyme R subunit
MLEKYEICRGLFHGFDWSAWIIGTSVQKLSLLPNALEHILRQQDGKNRLIKAVGNLSKAFALSVPHDEALRIRDDGGFFQAVRTVLPLPVPFLSQFGRRKPKPLEIRVRRGFDGLRNGLEWVGSDAE